MSHFTCAVILDERPTDENQLLEKALQPFHEYECTGIKDEFVVFVDEHADCLREYTEDTTEIWIAEDGERKSRYDDCFYRDPTPEEAEKIGPMPGTGFGGGGPSYHSKDWGDGRGYRAKVRMNDQERQALGWTKQEITHRDSGQYESLNDFARNYRCYEIENGRIGRWTNPQAQWDWWVIGGRWRGMIVAKDPSKAIVGRDGVMGSNFDAQGVDGCAVGNMDLKAMRAQKVAARRRGVMKSIQDKGIEWDEALEIWQAYVDAQAADFSAFHAQRSEGPHKAYHQWIDALPEDSPVKVFHRGPLGNCWGDWVAGIPKTERDPLAWIERAPPLGCYAVLKDGKWYAKGEMGWWGMSDDKHSQKEWDDKFAEMLAELPPEKWLVVVDCHI